MTPEKKFNQDVWYVLQEIKKKSLYGADNKSVSYEINFYVIASGCPSGKEEIAILEKLQQWQAIKITDKKDILDDCGLESGATYFLKILQPKFNEIYRRYEKLNTEFKSSDNGAITSLSAADRKKLCILEKLKEEWDLTPDRAKISQIKHSLWLRDCGITDYYEFEAILNLLKKEKLINLFHFVDESK